MASRDSWQERWRRWRLALATWALRLRFSTGKASFVEADIQMTTHHVADVLDAPGAATARRLLAHYQLKTRPPHAGPQGWRLLRERAGAAGTDQLVDLTCGFCGHHYIVQVLSALDPLASEAARGLSPGQPASYASEWFRFMHEDFEGKSSLNCLHCEQNGEPGVEMLLTNRKPD